MKKKKIENIIKKKFNISQLLIYISQSLSSMTNLLCYYTIIIKEYKKKTNRALKSQ